MARSGASDHIAIKQLKRAVMSQHKERPIARGIKTVDLHLSEGGTWRITIHQRIVLNTIQSQPFIKRVITAQIKPTKTHLEHVIKLRRMAFQELFLKHVKNYSKLTNFRKLTRIEGYNGK